MSFIGDWDVKWTHNTLPDPNRDPAQNAPVLKEGDTVVVTAGSKANSGTMSFTSQVKGHAGTLVAMPVLFFDNGTFLTGRYPMVIGTKIVGMYTAGAVLKVVDGSTQIVAWLSYLKTGSQDSGGQWGGPPK